MPDPAATADTPPSTGSSPRVSIAWLTFAGASSPYGFNFIGPVLPALQEAFALEAAQAQWLVSVYSLMLGLGQLVMGPISDTWGRRVVLLVGLALTILGSVGAMLAQSFEVVLVCRFLQGFGACTSLVVPRAVVRDLYTRPDEIARAIAIITTALSFTPGIAPLITGALLTWFSWRAGFASCAVLGIVSLVLALRHHPETLLQEKRADFHPVELFKIYVRIGSTPRFFAYTLSYSVLNCSVIAFLVIGPGALAQQYGLHAWGMAIGLLIVYGGFAAGNVYAVRHIRRTGVNRMLAAALGVAMVTGVLFVGSVYFVHSIYVTMGLLFLNAISNGFGFPSGIAGAVGLHPARAGTAAALVGATQLTICALIAVLAGVYADGSFRPLAWMVLAAALIAVAVAWPVFRKPANAG